MTPDLSLATRGLRETLANRAQRRLDQLSGQLTRRLRSVGQRLAHEDREDTLSGCARVLRLWRLAIKRCGIAERATNRSLVAFGTNERVDQRTQPGRRRRGPVRQNAAQEFSCAPPLVALEAKQDRRLVRKVLVERSDAHPGPL